jgi:hypothetical protein
MNKKCGKELFDFLSNDFGLRIFSHGVADGRKIGFSSPKNLNPSEKSEYFFLNYEINTYFYY